MFLHMDLYGVKAVIEVYINLKTVESRGIKYYLSMSIQDLTKSIWIPEILKFYMQQAIKEEGMFILMLVVVQVQDYINQQMVVKLGRK